MPGIKEKKVNVLFNDLKRVVFLLAVFLLGFYPLSARNFRCGFLGKKRRDMEPNKTTHRPIPISIISEEFGQGDESKKKVYSAHPLPTRYAITKPITKDFQ